MLQRSLKSAKPPKNVISLDTEADSEGNTYCYCVAGHYQGREIKQVFKSRAACVRYLFHRKWYNTVLTGLNLAFDLNTLYGPRVSFNWDCIYNMGRLITASPSKKECQKRGFTKRRQYLEIIDLGNFAQNTSLAKLAKDFKIEGYIDKHILGKDGDEKEMIIACLSHCMTAVLVFEEIQKRIYDLGGDVKLTSSSTSLDLFTKKYLKKEHQIYDFRERGDSKEVQEEKKVKVQEMKAVQRETYVGGRTEAFKHGRLENCGYIDINSSYPGQMQSKDFPDINSYRRYTTIATKKFLLSLLKKEEGCALIRVRTPKMNIPFLHSRSETRKLIFPVGELQGWYTFPEIRYALELGYKLLEVIEIQSYRRLKESPFKDYIDDLMKFKLECKPVAKLLMNGLSGKFGQRLPEKDAWSMVHDEDNIVVDNKKYFELEGTYWKYEKPEEEEEIENKDFAYPLWVAYITAWGRIQEHKAIMAIGPENVYYMDTDSIIGDFDAIKKAIDTGKIEFHPSNLGTYAWEKVDEEGNPARITVEIRGEKYYRWHLPRQPWNYVIRGVPKYACATHWKYHGCTFKRPRKLRGALRSGEKVNKFINVTHKDLKVEPKRVWEGDNSEPIEIHLF